MSQQRSCDGCTECCYVFPLYWVRKGSHATCIHADPGGVGCRVYGSRGDCAGNWQCAWLAGDLDEALKPDVIGGFIDALHSADTIRVYGRDGLVPESLVGVAIRNSHRPRCEVHVYHKDGVKVYRDGGEVVPLINVQPLELRH